MSAQRQATSAASVSLRTLDDDALVAQLRDGSRAAVGELFRRHAPAIRAVVVARGGRNDADDVVQETFLVVLNGRFTPAPGRTLGWLRGIAVRILSKRRRAAYDEIVTDADALIADRPCGDE